MPVESVPRENETEQQKRERLLSKAYSRANANLRDAHTDEFNGYYQKQAADLGVEWSPRLTPEQKAEQEARELLDKFPHLAELFRAEPGDGVAPTG